jgi:hypothetical protein
MNLHSKQPGPTPRELIYKALSARRPSNPLQDGLVPWLALQGLPQPLSKENSRLRAQGFGRWGMVPAWQGLGLCSGTPRHRSASR